MPGHVLSYSSSYTVRNTQPPMTKPRTRHRVDTAVQILVTTTAERQGVVISWLIANSFLLLSVSGIKEEGVVCKPGFPSPTSHSHHVSHGCSLCEPLRSAIGPSPHSPPGSDNVSLKPKLQSVWQRA